MYFTSALVLSTLAVGQAAAVSNKHASFHARRQQSQETPRDVDYSKVDYSHVDWNKALQGVDFNSKSAPSAAAPSSAAGYKAPEPTPAAAAVYTSAAAAASSASSPQSSSKSDTSTSNPIGNKLTSTVAQVANRLSLKPALNSQQKCDTAWIGDDGKWKATFSNTRDEAATLYCFKQSTDGAGQFIKVNAAAIGVTVAKDSPVTISFADDFSGACVPVYSDTNCAVPAGNIYNTYLEFTFNNAVTHAGGFDVSRQPNMKGSSISAKGSTNGCTSDMESCVFKCTNGSNDCWQSGTYDLFPLQNRPKGCNGGFDAAMKGTGGSCEIPTSQSSEHVMVTLS